MDALARWLASVSPDIPLHVSRFFPRHKIQDKSPTPVDTVYRLADVARSTCTGSTPATADTNNRNSLYLWHRLFRLFFGFQLRIQTPRFRYPAKATQTR